MSDVEEQHDQQSQVQEPVHVDEVKHVKLPPFWTTDPVLWFAQVDAQFISSRIRSDITKYYTVITALDCETLKHVRDLLTNPPETGKYTSLKTKLIARFTDSEDRLLKKLLTEMELGDRKPSQLLKEMQNLAEKRVTNEVLRTLWIQRLPAQVELVLSASDGPDNSKLADIADKVFEVSSSHPTSILPIEKDTYKKSREWIPTPIDTAVSELSKQVQKLTEAVRKLQQRNSARSRTRSSSRNRDRNLCYYHNKFGAAAKECTTPCSFSMETSENATDRR